MTEEYSDETNSLLFSWISGKILLDVSKNDPKVHSKLLPKGYFKIFKNVPNVTIKYLSGEG